jgi:hypothetical protein
MRREGRCVTLTRRGELRVGSLSHDPLQTHACTYKPDADKRQRIAPGGITACIWHARLSALPNGDSCRHGEKSLDKGAKGKPGTCLAAHLIANATYEGAKDERDEGAKRLLVCEMERVIMLAIEKAGECECELDVVSDWAGDGEQGGNSPE